MNSYDFICTVRIDAETQEEATQWFNYKTEGLDTNVMEIEVQEWVA
jgi:hypothetical protein